MRRAGGVFVAGFLCFGAYNALTEVIPTTPEASASVPIEKGLPKKDSVKFSGTGASVKKGSVPVARYEELINTWGKKCKALTPALLAAQLYQESGFRTDRGAVSSANAMGFAQFIPSTWKVHGIDANKDGKKDIWDPEDAIPSAATYDCKLASYVKDVPGNNRKNMLAAYNAGSGAVKKYSGVPPYKETQNYVRIITSTAGRFER